MKRTTPIRAFHKPSKTWRFASLSGYDVKSQKADYCRVDPRAGEELEEFVCYPVIPLEGNAFTVAGGPIKLPHTYS